MSVKWAVCPRGVELPGLVVYGRGARTGAGWMLSLFGQAWGWVLADARKILVLLRGTTIFVSWVGGMLWVGRSFGRVGTSTLASRGTSVVRTLVGGWAAAADRHTNVAALTTTVERWRCGKRAAARALSVGVLTQRCVAGGGAQPCEGGGGLAPRPGHGGVASAPPRTPPRTPPSPPPRASSRTSLTTCTASPHSAALCPIPLVCPSSG